METVTIRTTENVNIDYKLASTGSRIGAFCLDAAIFGLCYNLGVALLLFNSEFSFLGEILFLYGNLFFFLLYHFCFELVNRGQSPGKRIVGIRVIRLDGRDPVPADFLTRAIFVLPDIIFSVGIPAVLLISSSRHKQRLGDMVAGTALIQSTVSSAFTLRDILTVDLGGAQEAEFPEVQRFTDTDMIVVKHTLERLKKYGNAAHRQAARQLAQTLADQMALDKASIRYTPQEFLTKLLQEYVVLTR